jgi:hypothetical protein
VELINRINMKLYLKYLPFVFVSVHIFLQGKRAARRTINRSLLMLRREIDSVELQDEETHELRALSRRKNQAFSLDYIPNLMFALTGKINNLMESQSGILEPYFYDQSELVLDAKDFDFHQIRYLKVKSKLL